MQKKMGTFGTWNVVSKICLEYLALLKNAEKQNMKGKKKYLRGMKID